MNRIHVSFQVILLEVVPIYQGMYVISVEQWGIMVCFIFIEKQWEREEFIKKLQGWIVH